MVDPSKWVEWVKLAPRYLLAIALLTGAVLFAPADFAAVLGLATLPQPVRIGVGLGFLASACLLIANWLADGATWGKEEWRRRRDLEALHQRLHNLTSEEKAILRAYVEGKTRTQYLDYSDGVVRGLEHERIIYRSAEVGHMESWAYIIQPWAWNYLNQHRELLAS